MAIKQYPHFLFVHQVSESYKDDDGNWTEPGESIVLHSMCREEPNGKGSTVNLADGKAKVFSSNVFLPKGVDRIADGSEIIICDTNDITGNIRIKGTVLRFTAGQLNAKLWV